MHSELWFFFDFKKRVVNQYLELFAKGDEQSDTSAKAGFTQKWGWYPSIYHCAGGSLTKFDEVTGLHLTTCLTFLAFDKEKNEIETQQLKHGKQS